MDKFTPVSSEIAFLVVYMFFIQQRKIYRKQIFKQGRGSDKAPLEALVLSPILSYFELN